jgi:HicB-like protein involved in pilus formation
VHIDGHIQALREDLARIAAVGDASTAHAAELLSMALESSISRRLLEALGEAALELNAQLDDGRVEVRFAGADPEFVFVREEAEEPQASPDETLSARITLRLPDALKQRVEDAAAREGVSVNTWIVQALGRIASGAPRRSSGRRLTGYGRS